jgi:hypothetical protein
MHAFTDMVLVRTFILPHPAQFARSLSAPQEVEFASVLEFQEWLEARLTEHNEAFRRVASGADAAGNRRVTFYCRRSGQLYREATKRAPSGERRARTSHKLTTRCPAGLRVVVFVDTGRVTVSVLPNHAGHDPRTDAHQVLPMSRTMRQDIHRQLLMGMTVKQVLADVRHRTNNLRYISEHGTADISRRDQIISLKDVENIARVVHGKRYVPP